MDSGALCQGLRSDKRGECVVRPQQPVRGHQGTTQSLTFQTALESFSLWCLRQRVSFGDVQNEVCLRLCDSMYARRSPQGNGGGQARTVSDTTWHLSGAVQSRRCNKAWPLTVRLTFRHLGPTREGSFLCHTFLQQTAGADGRAD